jgi:hypothetical protein
MPTPVQKITKGIDYLNKLRYRTEQAAASKSLFQAVKLKYEVLRDLKSEGFSDKEISTKFRKLVRANTAAQIEQAREDIIKDLTKQREFVKGVKIAEKMADEKKALIQDIRKQSKLLEGMKLTDANRDAYDSLMENLTTKKISDRKLKKLAATRDYLEEASKENEVVLPKSVYDSLELLERKTLEDLEISELEELSIALKAIKAQDKLLKKFIIKGQEVESKKVIDKVSSIIDNNTTKTLEELEKPGFFRDVFFKGTDYINRLNLYNWSHPAM